MKKIVLAMLVALIALAMVPVNAEVQGNIREPIDGWVYSDCAEEYIAFAGEAHLLYAVTEDGAGGYHVKWHENIKGTGEGEVSGDTYQINAVLNEKVNVAKGEEATLTESIEIIGQGKAANMVLKWDAHITVNANGEMTVDRDNYRIDCH